jgi:hypothetical protein
MTAGTLIQRLEDTETPDNAWMTRLIKRGPINGVDGGCHSWVYRAARGLYRYRRRHKLTEEDLFTILRAKTEDYVRHVTDGEIQDAITSAIRDLEDPDYKAGQMRTWPEPDFKRVDELVTNGFGFRELKDSSPLDLTSNPVTSDQVVRHLFAYEPGVNDPLICAGEYEEDAVPKPLSEWLKGQSWLNGKLSQQSFIVPSRMSRLLGTNQDGELSTRCLDNTGEREYLVVEADISKFNNHKEPTPWKSWVERWEQIGLTIADACASILWHLQQFAPLVLAVHSGGKSIHGWFPCRGVAEATLQLFFQYAVMLGADHRMWTRCQLVRMPEGTRANLKRQRVVYYDPKTIIKRQEAATA